MPKNIKSPHWIFFIPSNFNRFNLKGEMRKFSPNVVILCLLYIITLAGRLCVSTVFRAAAKNLFN